MADVTISQLPNTTPSLGSIIPVSLGGTTYSTVLQQLTSLPFIPKAFGSFNTNSNGNFSNINTFNVSSIELTNSIYKVIFRTPMPTANYTVLLTCSTSQSYNLVATIGDGSATPSNFLNTNYFYFYNYQRPTGNTDYALYNSFAVYHH